MQVESVTEFLLASGMNFILLKSYILVLEDILLSLLGEDIVPFYDASITVVFDTECPF